MAETAHNRKFNRRNIIFNSSTAAPASGVSLTLLRAQYDELKQRFAALEAELHAALAQQQDDVVPLSLITPGLGVLEALALFLAKGGRTNTQIAALLHREYSTIANTLRNARRKSAKSASAAAAPFASATKNGEMRVPPVGATPRRTEGSRGSQTSGFAEPSRKYSLKTPLRSPLRAAAAGADGTIRVEATDFSSEDVLIPLSIFWDETIAPLQALVRYLHEERGLRFVEIARATGRDPRVINASYRRARR